MPLICSVKWRKYDLTRRLNDRLCLGVEEEGAAMTVTSTKLLTCNSEHTVRAITHEYGFRRGAYQNPRGIKRVGIMIR